MDVAVRYGYIICHPASQPPSPHVPRLLITAAWPLIQFSNDSEIDAPYLGRCRCSVRRFQIIRQHSN
eukprot:4811297-Pyramimonas_sp.AAC.1